MTGDAVCGRCETDRCAAIDALAALVAYLGGVEAIPIELLSRASAGELELVWGPNNGRALLLASRPRR